MYQQPAYYQRPSRGLSPAGPSPFAPDLGRGPGSYGALWTNSVPPYDAPRSTTGSAGWDRPFDRGLAGDAPLPFRGSALAPEYGAIPGACPHRDGEYLPDRFSDRFGDRFGDRLGERLRQNELPQRSWGIDPSRYSDLYSDPFAQREQRSSDLRPSSLRGWEEARFGDGPSHGRFDPLLQGDKYSHGLRAPAGLRVPSFPEPEPHAWRQPWEPRQPNEPYLQPEMQRPYQNPYGVREARKDPLFEARFGAAPEVRKDLPTSFETRLPATSEAWSPLRSSETQVMGPAAEGPAVTKAGMGSPSAGSTKAAEDWAAPAAEAPPVIILGDGCVKEPSKDDAGQAAALAPSLGAMARLQDCEARLQSASAELGATEAAIRLDQVSPGQAWNDLAQLEARLDQLQCKGIDFVSIEGLSAEDSEVARSKRRQLTRAVAKLQDQVEATFDRLKSSRAGP